MSEGDLAICFAAIHEWGPIVSEISFDAVLLHLGRWLYWRSPTSSFGYFHDGMQWCPFRCHDEKTHHELEKSIGDSVRVNGAKVVYDKDRYKFMIHLDGAEIAPSSMPTFQTRAIPSYTPHALKANFESVSATIRSGHDWIAEEKVVTVENVYCADITFMPDGYHYALRSDDDDTTIDLCSGIEHLWQQLHNVQRRLLFETEIHFDVIGCRPYKRPSGATHLDMTAFTILRKRTPIDLVFNALCI